MFIKADEASEYLNRLSLRISQNRDLWKDPAHRAKHLAADTNRFADVSSWVEEKTYTFQMAFCTNGM